MLGPSFFSLPFIFYFLDIRRFLVIANQTPVFFNNSNKNESFFLFSFSFHSQGTSLDNKLVDKGLSHLNHSVVPSSSTYFDTSSRFNVSTIVTSRYRNINEKSSTSTKTVSLHTEQRFPHISGGLKGHETGVCKARLEKVPQEFTTVSQESRVSLKNCLEGFTVSKSLDRSVLLWIVQSVFYHFLQDIRVAFLLSSKSFEVWMKNKPWNFKMAFRPIAAHAWGVGIFNSFTHPTHVSKLIHEQQLLRDSYASEFTSSSPNAPYLPSEGMLHDNVQLRTLPTSFPKRPIKHRPWRRCLQEVAEKDDGSIPFTTSPVMNTSEIILTDSPSVFSGKQSIGSIPAAVISYNVEMESSTNQVVPSFPRSRQSQWSEKSMSSSHQNSTSGSYRMTSTVMDTSRTNMLKGKVNPLRILSEDSEPSFLGGGTSNRAENPNEIFQKFSISKDFSQSVSLPATPTPQQFSTPMSGFQSGSGLTTQFSEPEFVPTTEASQGKSVPTTETSQEESVPTTETSQEESVPTTETFQEESVPTTEAFQEESVPTTETSQEESVPTTEAFQEESVPTTETFQEESVPTTEAFQEESVPTTEAFQEESVPTTEAFQEESVPTTEAFQEESVPTTETSQGESVPTTETSQGESVPTAVSLQKDSIPTTGASWEKPVPTTVSSQKESIPTTGASREKPVATTVSLQTESVPTTGASREKPLPTTVSSQKESIPTTGASREKPVATTVSLQTESVPTTGASREKPVPTTVSSQKESVPTTGASREKPVPTTGASREKPVPTTVSSQKESVPTTGASREKPVPTTVSSQKESIPTTGASREKPVPTTVSSQKESVPTTGASREKPVATTVSLQTESVPTTGASREKPVPTTVSSQKESVPTTGASREKPVPTTVSSQKESVPTTGASREKPVATTVSLQTESVPTTGASREKPVATTVSLQTESVPTTGASREKPVPTTVSLQTESVPTTGASREKPVATTVSLQTESIPTTGASREKPVPRTGTSREKPVPTTVSSQKESIPTRTVSDQFSSGVDDAPIIMSPVNKSPVSKAGGGVGNAAHKRPSNILMSSVSSYVPIPSASAQVFVTSSGESVKSQSTSLSSDTIENSTNLFDKMKSTGLLYLKHPLEWVNLNKELISMNTFFGFSSVLLFVRRFLSFVIPVDFRPSIMILPVESLSQLDLRIVLLSALSFVIGLSFFSLLRMVLRALCYPFRFKSVCCKLEGVESRIIRMENYLTKETKRSLNFQERVLKRFEQSDGWPCEHGSTTMGSEGETRIIHAVEQSLHPVLRLTEGLEKQGVELKESIQELQRSFHFLASTVTRITGAMVQSESSSNGSLNQDASLETQYVNPSEDCQFSIGSEAYENSGAVSSSFPAHSRQSSKDVHHFGDDQETQVERPVLDSDADSDTKNDDPIKLVEKEQESRPCDSLEKSPRSSSKMGGDEVSGSFWRLETAKKDDHEKSAPPVEHFQEESKTTQVIKIHQKNPKDLGKLFQDKESEHQYYDYPASGNRFLNGVPSSPMNSRESFVTPPDSLQQGISEPFYGARSDLDVYSDLTLGNGSKIMLNEMKPSLNYSNQEPSGVTLAQESRAPLLDPGSTNEVLPIHPSSARHPTNPTISFPPEHSRVNTGAAHSHFGATSSMTVPFSPFNNTSQDNSGVNFPSHRTLDGLTSGEISSGRPGTLLMPPVASNALPNSFSSSMASTRASHLGDAYGTAANVQTFSHTMPEETQPEQPKALSWATLGSRKYQSQMKRRPAPQPLKGISDPFAP